jgi:NADH:ubiquinone oxidoreductase subunit C
VISIKQKRISLKDFRREMEKLKGFRLITISALDSRGCYHLLYHFDIGGVKTLKVLIPEKKPVIKSVVDIFPSAEFYEREIHDFFNIEFKGNLRLHDKMFLPDDWKDRPPLRKDKSD